MPSVEYLMTCTEETNLHKELITTQLHIWNVRTCTCMSGMPITHSAFPVVRTLGLPELEISMIT